tara:strand:+ start:396 stop:668 length:273 start_codon:yes stop_codon:yes gene_type:complete
MYFDIEALILSVVLGYGTLAVFHYGFNFIMDVIEERILKRFFFDRFYLNEKPFSKLTYAIGICFEWVIPVILGISVAVMWYLIRIDVIVL